MGKADALNGRWTSNWGEVRLNVADGAITGTWSQGGVEGKASDDGAVSLTWTHRDGTTGKAALKADAGFAKLSGTWGYGEADTGEGDWSMDQVERVGAAPTGDAPAGDAPAGDAPAGDAAAGDGPPAGDPPAEKPKKGK